MNAFMPTVEELPQNHPVQIYYKESELIQELLHELYEVDVKEDFQKYYNVFNNLRTIDKRFTRKENQLFPYLEKYGWEGPSQGMWSFHDNLREQMRILDKYNSEKNFDKIIENLPFLIEGVKRLLVIEDMRLFPNSMELLSEDDWKEFYEGDEEIGWMLAEKPAPYPTVEKKEAAYVHPSEDFSDRTQSFSLENTHH